MDSLPSMVKIGLVIQVLTVVLDRSRPRAAAFRLKSLSVMMPT